jgi:hypothetical protein
MDNERLRVLREEMDATIELIRDKIEKHQSTFHDEDYLKKLREEFFKELTKSTEVAPKREGGIEL